MEQHDMSLIKDTTILFDSIDNLDSLLEGMLTLFLNLLHADSGSIQLINNGHTFTKIHRQFPDKIRQFFKHADGTLISEISLETQKIISIQNFTEQRDIQGCPILNVTALMCIPLFYKDVLLGFIHLATVDGSPVFSTIDTDALDQLIAISSSSLRHALLLSEVKKKREIEKEINAALSIQNQLLPINVPYAPNFEFARIAVASKELSGDFHDFIKLPNDLIGVVIVDITGKGIQAGLFIAMIKGILKIFLPDFTSPKEAIQKVNEVLCKRNVIKKYIPMFYAIVNTQKMSVSYCNAGMEPSLLCSNQTIKELSTGGPPVGAFDDSTYEEESILMKPNDFIVMITDGITDARNEKENDLGYEKVVSLLKDSQGLSIQNVLNKVLDFAKTFIGERNQKDDITLVGIKLAHNETSIICLEPTETYEKKIDGSACGIKTISDGLKQFLNNSSFSEKAKETFSTILFKINQTLLKQSYVQAPRGDILYKFLLYPDKVEFIIRDYGLGVSLGSLKISLGDYYDVFEDVWLVSTKVGTEIHMTKKY
ncbi:SpoIIE family protein phosphatase [bacterium]|jgi:serine phosphatase RsbU (regulator of sigma subunit)|nr:SpoIIE family protein phosphatase [bacterium]